MDSSATSGMSAVERSFSLKEAEAKVTEALDSLGVHPVLQDRDRNRFGLTAVSCVLKRPDGTEVPKGNGAGKGNYEEARVGALFEALEHLLTGNEYFKADEVYLQNKESVAVGPLARESSMAILNQAPPDTKIACWKYQSLSSPEHTAPEQIDVPLYISSPWYLETKSQSYRDRVSDTFNYQGVARYSVNSGCAIGANEEEALVHALNEVIERDAFSLLLARSFLGQGVPPQVVDTATLPEELSNLLASLENRIGQAVFLLDITTDLGVPAYMAYVRPTEEKPQLHGSGASLSPHYAAYRAISELLQSFLLVNHQWNKEFQRQELAPLEKYPALYASGYFDLSSLLDRAQSVDFIDRPAPRGPRQNLIELREILTSKGFSAYRRIMHMCENHIAAVHVFIPGMEHFMVVTQGGMVIPGQRGMEAVQR